MASPYELRFAILQQAINFIQDEYYADIARKEILQPRCPEGPWLELPTFPSYEKVEVLAERMNRFVSN